jgi:hypothetical protein
MRSPVSNIYIAFGNPQQFVCWCSYKFLLFISSSSIMAISTPIQHESEKAGGVHNDNVTPEENATMAKGLDDEDEDFTPAEQRKIIHRIDRRLIATTGIMYCISLMDRTNLSAAAIAGMRVDLELIQQRYVSHHPLRSGPYLLTPYRTLSLSSSSSHMCCSSRRPLFFAARSGLVRS